MTATAPVYDLDQLLAESYLAAGMRPDVVASRLPSMRDHVLDLADRLNTARPATIRRKPSTWTPAEDEHIRSNLGILTDAEIGAALGRSADAVHIRRERVLHLPAPSKHPAIFTGNKAARALGLDIHKLSYLVDTGIIPARVMAGLRRIRLIRREDLTRWAVDPRNWPWFKLDRVADPQLKRLIELRRQRWGDEWWSTRQAADYHGVDVSDIKRYIQAGRLPAVQVVNYDGRISLHERPAWSYWFIRKSHAQAVTFYRRKGNTAGRRGLLPQAAKDFITLCHDAGVPYAGIASMMNLPFKSVLAQIEWQRLHGLPNGFVDWREHADRFPAITRAVQALQAGCPLDRNRLRLLRSILIAWADHYQVRISRVPMPRLTMAHLCAMRAQLVAAGVDPFAPLPSEGRGQGEA
jgi:hypothetical protein